MLALLLAVVALVPASPVSAKSRRPGVVWDDDVEPVASDVAAIYGRAFRHPVRTSLLDPAAFAAASDAGIGAGSSSPFREVALGLARPNTDTGNGMPRARKPRASTQPAGFFEPFTDHLYVNGDTVEGAVEVVLAHELTHALQWQTYRPRFDTAPLDDVANEVGRAVIEGDASRVHERYLESHDEIDIPESVATPLRHAWDVPTSPGALSDTTAFLYAEEWSAYTLGRSLTEAIVAHGGTGSLRGWFVDTPVDDLPLLDPLQVALITPDETPSPAPKVQAPAVTRPERKRGPTTRLGAVLLYYLLASRIDPVDALHAARLWNGDRMVVVTNSSGICARVRIRTEAGAESLTTALDAWAAAVGPAASMVEEPTARVVTMCGTHAPRADGSAIAVAAFTAQLSGSVAADEVQRDVPVGTARCVVDTFDVDPRIRALVDELRDPDYDATRVRRSLEAEIPTARARARAACATSDS